MREEDLGRYQMLWDCPACGSQGLLGVDHRFCPSCGTAQDPASRYFPSDEQKILVEDHPYHGADVICPACDTPNAASSGFCQACGSPLEDGKAAARRDDKVVGEGETFEGETAKDARDEAKARKQAEEARRRARMAGQDPDAEPAGGKKKGGLMGLGLVGTGCVAIIGLIAVVGIAFCALSWLWQSSDQVTVQGHTWKRSIAVEVYGPTEAKAWRDEVPAGAEIKRCRDEKRDSKKVEDGEDCRVVKKDKGDGTFSEKKVCEPKYKTVDVMGEKCTYTVDAWKKKRTEQAAGTDLSPKWPTVKLSKTGTCRGCEREGARKETYTVVLTDSEGGKHTCDLPESKWKGLKKGQTRKATFGGLTGAIDCGSL